MSDRLLSEVAGDALPITDGTSTLSLNDGDIDYQSDTETEQPVILEIGVTPTVNPTLNYASSVHMSGNSAYIEQPPTPTQMQTQPLPLNCETTPAPASINLYSNPYASHALTMGASVETHSLHSLMPPPPPPPPLRRAAKFSIPKTVSSWADAIDGGGSTSAGTSTDGTTKRRSITDLVPPPTFVAYNNLPREHTITCELNPSWREKALQIEKDYKKTACDRERTRMRDMNRAFDLLRSKLPISKPNGKKYSKIESLRIAINYINHLQQSLRNNEVADMDIISLRSTNKHSHQQNGVDFVLGLDSSSRRSESFNFDAARNADQNGAWSNDNDVNYDTNGDQDWE